MFLKKNYNLNDKLLLHNWLQWETFTRWGFYLLQPYHKTNSIYFLKSHNQFNLSLCELQYMYNNISVLHGNYSYNKTLHTHMNDEMKNFANINSLIQSSNPEQKRRQSMQNCDCLPHPTKFSLPLFFNPFPFPFLPLKKKEKKIIKITSQKPNPHIYSPQSAGIAGNHHLWKYRWPSTFASTNPSF